MTDWALGINAAGVSEDGLQLDLVTLLARIAQINAEQPPEHWLWERVMTCDMPRLTARLTPEMIALCEPDLKVVDGVLELTL